MSGATANQAPNSHSSGPGTRSLQPLQTCRGSDGPHLKYQGFGCKVGHNHLHSAVEVGAHAVHLVDKADAGHPVLVSLQQWVGLSEPHVALKGTNAVHLVDDAHVGHSFTSSRCSRLFCKTNFMLEGLWGTPDL